MQTRSTLSALALVLAAGFAGSAFAESPNAVPQAGFNGAKSRVEVQAELLAYQQAGVNPWSISYNPVRNFQGTNSRAAVVADFLAARDQVHALNGEDSGSAWLAQARTPGVPANQFAGQ